MNARRRKDWPAGASTSAASAMSASNNKKSALSAAYAELGKELTSGKIRSVGTYTLGRPIGEGTYGKVRLGTHRLSGTRVAIKQVPKAYSDTLTREIHHHRRLHHPNVMQLYEVLATESYIWMVTELCAGGELYDYLVERGTMPEPEARRIFGQLCLAVAYIHDRGIVHRDLKLENVLLDERCNVKLGDFGFTREFEGKRLMETFCGTTGYAAPEMLAGRRYTGEEVDVWSLGVILYALVCGALPFDDDDESVMKAKILRGEYELPDVLSDECKELITMILQQDPASRPAIKEILSHSWFGKVMGSTYMETVDEDAHDVSLMTAAAQQVDGINGADGKHAAGLIVPSRDHAVAVASPGPIEADELTHKASASTMSSTSFFSARSKSDSDTSDRKSSDTGTTNPTTEEGEQDTRSLHVGNEEEEDGEDRCQPAPLSWRHRNESQTTIRRQTSSGSETSRKAAPKAASTPLPTHVETSSEAGSPEAACGVEEHSNSAPPALMTSAPLEQRPSQGSQRGAGGSVGASGHHRTPSRTKRRSSGGLSDHHPPSLDVRPVNYVAQLEDSSSALFSTVLEQNLLHQLSMLGLDVGQVVHSVVNEACDASGAMWWILKKKAEEREEREADVGQSLLAGVRDGGSRSRKNSNASQVLTNNANLVNIAASPSWQSRELVRPTAVKAIAPQRVDAKTGPDTASMSAFMASVEDDGVREQEEGSVASHAQSTTNVHAPLRSQRPVEQRTRASSFSARLTSVLAGKEKDKDSRKDAAGDKAAAGGEALVGVGERAKSPALGSLFKKATGERGSPGPSTPNKAEKQKKKDSRSPLQQQGMRNASKGDEIGELTMTTTGKSGAAGDEARPLLIMHPATSTETFSTISSQSQHSGSPETGASKSSRPAKSSFLHTVRNWLGSEEKEKANGGESSRKKKKKKRRSNQVVAASQNGTIKRAPSLKGGSTLNSPHVSRTGSVRRAQAAHNYHLGPLPRSPRIGHRGASISRRSSSGSVHYAPANIVPPPRPISVRRQSAGSITPTALYSSTGGVDEHLYHYRGSRPSSAQSFHRVLHARSGSTGSVKSFVRIPSHESGYSGSLRGIHARRPSIDGGTTVRRHRHYPQQHQHHHGRSDSQSHSRPSTPGRYAAPTNSADETAGTHDLVTPRRSFDSYNGGGRASPMHTPRASQSVFVAHRSRTPYKPPSANPSLMRLETEPQPHEQPYGGAYMHGYGHRVPYGRMMVGYGGGHLPLGTWRRSWGKPPPSWKGPIDEDHGLAAGATGGGGVGGSTLGAGAGASGKPKLRDVFAVRESDDDWEDEDEEPTYAGGLGQLASSSWGTDHYGSTGTGGVRSKGNGVGVAIGSSATESMPASMSSRVGSGVRALFQAPSLGRETMPKTWITSDDGQSRAVDASAGEPGQPGNSPVLSTKPLPAGTVGQSVESGGMPTSSRVRSAAPTFKGPITIEEEEEDE